jgi:signal transduction histidine kinase
MQTIRKRLSILLVVYSLAAIFLITLFGEKDKLKQVFINLISNALKFTKCDGKICVNLYGDDKQIIVEIEDNGFQGLLY